MTGKTKRIAAIIFAVVMMFAVVAMVAGCTSRDEALVGTWVSEDDPTWVTTFNEDGTGTHTQSWGFGTSFEWSTPGNNIRWDYPGTENMDSPYSISGDALYITIEVGDGETITYRYIRD